MSLHGHWTSSMSLHISWQPIPICERYGLIVGYNIFWNKSNEVNGNFSHRFTEDLFIDVSQLVPYEFYRVTVAGRTFVGPGPNVSIVVRTDQDSKSIYFPKYFLFF